MMQYPMALRVSQTDKEMAKQAGAKWTLKTWEARNPAALYAADGHHQTSDSACYGRKSG
jgi:hypothetical protein